MIEVITFLGLFVLFLILIYSKQIMSDYIRKKLPIKTDNATLIAKNEEVVGRYTQTLFYLTFELSSGERKTFKVKNKDYFSFMENDFGILTYREREDNLFFEQFERCIK